MSNTYTFNNLNFTNALLQNADFMQDVEESISDYMSHTADFVCKYCTTTNTLQVTFDTDLSVADLANLADCYAEILLMPQAYA